MSTGPNIIENLGNAPNVPVTNHSARIASIHPTARVRINCFNGPNATPLPDNQYAEILNGVVVGRGCKVMVNSFNGNVGVGNTNCYSSTAGPSWSMPVWTGLDHGTTGTSGDHWDHSNWTWGAGANQSRRARTRSTFTGHRAVSHQYTASSTTSISTSNSSVGGLDSILSAGHRSRVVQTTIETSNPRNDVVVVESDYSSSLISEPPAYEETFIDPDDFARSGSPSQKSQKKGRRYRAWWLRKGLQVFEGVKKGLVGFCKLAC